MIMNLFFKNKLAPQVKNDPQFSVVLKDKEGEEFVLADPRATRALLACMDMEAGLGGAASHWGGPSAFAEIMSALYALIFKESEQKKISWFERFHLINDAGHCENGIYALKANYGMANLTLEELKKFRSIQSVLTGHGEAHLFPEGVYLSNGPLGSTVAQAQGLAMADCRMKKERMCVLTLSDGACMEGEVKESLAAIPGFAKRNLLNPFLLVISDNNTKLSGRIHEDSFSLKPTFESLKSLNWKTYSLQKGNDLSSVLNVLKQALKSAWDDPQTPVVVLAQTVKGFGVEATAQSSSGGHGFPLKDPKELQKFVQEIYKEEAIPSKILKWCSDISLKSQFRSEKSYKKVQAGVSQAIIEKKEQKFPIVSITSDLFGSTGMGPFRKQFPEDSFDVGVAESNMISVATGFSKQGFLPIVDTFAQFAITKGALPLIMSALSEAPVIGIFSHAGFQDAADGASHQALSYFAITCSLPYAEVYSLSCSKEGYSLVSQGIEEFAEQKKKGKKIFSKIFFMGRETFPEDLGAKSYELRKAQVLFSYEEGKNPTLIVATGPLVYEALKAVKNLKQNNQGVVVINNASVSHPDVETISFWLKKCHGKLITLEDHQVKGGMGQILLSSLSEKNHFPTRFRALGVRGEFGRSAYTASDLYKQFGLDKDSIEKEVIQINS